MSPGGGSIMLCGGLSAAGPGRLVAVEGYRYAAEKSCSMDGYRRTDLQPQTCQIYTGFNRRM